VVGVGGKERGVMKGEKSGDYLDPGGGCLSCRQRCAGKWLSCGRGWRSKPSEKRGLCGLRRELVLGKRFEEIWGAGFAGGGRWGGIEIGGSLWDRVGQEWVGGKQGGGGEEMGWGR